MKVTIEKSNGEKLTIIGPPEEVALLLKLREEEEERRAATVVEALQRPAEEIPNQIEQLRQLVEYLRALLQQPQPQPQPQPAGLGTTGIYWRIGTIATTTADAAKPEVHW